MAERPDDLEMAIQIYESEYARGSELLKKMRAPSRRRFHEILNQLRKDTNFELSETEYFSLAKRLYFCEAIEVQMELQGSENVPKDVLIMYDKVQESILMVMRRYREGRIEQSNSLDRLRHVMLELADENGTLKVEYNKEKVIDASAVRTGEVEEDTGHRCDELDPSPVQDQERDG